MAAPNTGVLVSEGEDESGRKVRGRPRLTDKDRVQRRLESRKKYDCRRVYLGEAHGAWVLRREAGGGTGEEEAWSDAKLAAYLLALERNGKPSKDAPRIKQRIKRRRQCVNNLLNLVTWYHDHRNHCPHEPGLTEIDTSHILYTSAVWQCQEGHRFFQVLRCPLKTLNYTVGGGDGASSDDSSSSLPTEEQSSEICSQTELTEHTLYSHSSESLEEARVQGAGGAEAVMCVPMGPNTGGFFEDVSQEELGHVVAASCPSQVIIIAGPGYEALTAGGIQLDVTGGSSGEEGTCAALEAVSTYTQTEPEDQEEEQRSAGAVTEEESLYNLQSEEAEALELQPDPHLPEETFQGQSELAPVEGQDYRTDTAQQVLYEHEKRKSRRSRVLDGDEVLDMYHCPYEGCTLVYTALGSFQNHVNLVHRKGKTKVCPEPGCGKKFYLSNHLRRHMIIHTGVREFICETCGKSFKRKSHLEVHRRTHTGETPLQCEVCGFQCRQRASLNWHMKKHRAETHYSFFCEHCGKGFEKQDSVKFHKLKSHPEGRTT
ncbi:zinc finger protein 653 [Rhinophrynus dorsalis]